MSNQITEMFKASNARQRRILKGDFDLSVMTVEQKEAEIQIKLGQLVMSAYAIASKNDRAIKGLKSMNFMDDQIAIELMGLSELDKVKCPEKNGSLISLHDCLDYSGEMDHLEDCKTCETFSKSRELVGPPLHTA